MFESKIPPYLVFLPILPLVFTILYLWPGVYSLSVLIYLYLSLLLHSAPKELELLTLVEMEVEGVKVQ